jgi:hypothetical protein
MSRDLEARVAALEALVTDLVADTSPIPQVAAARTERQRITRGQRFRDMARLPPRERAKAIAALPYYEQNDFFCSVSAEEAVAILMSMTDVQRMSFKQVLPPHVAMAVKVAETSLVRFVRSWARPGLAYDVRVQGWVYESKRGLTPGNGARLVTADAWPLMLEADPDLRVAFERGEIFTENVPDSECRNLMAAMLRGESLAETVETCRRLYRLGPQPRA